MKNYYLFILSIALPFMAVAQQSYSGISYNMSAPFGSTSDHADNFSWRGGSVESNFFVTDEVSVGAFVAWNVFKTRVDGEFTSGSLTATGTQQRFVNAVPILIDARYHFGGLGDRMPYIGFGIGTMYAEHLTQMGIFEVVDDGWQFAISPSVGYLIALNRAALNLGVRYNWGLGSDDLDGTQYLSINVGFAWMQ